MRRCVLREEAGGVQHLDTLWKVISAASTVRDLAQETKSYEFLIEPAITFYLHVEYASVQLKRWNQPKITIAAQLQAGFGWRVATDQDEVGVYFVAKRRAVVGNLSRAQFTIRVPHETYLVFKLQNSAFTFDSLNHTLQIPPTKADGSIHLASGTKTRLFDG